VVVIRQHRVVLSVGTLRIDLDQSVRVRLDTAGVDPHEVALVFLVVAVGGGTLRASGRIDEGQDRRRNLMTTCRAPEENYQCSLREPVTI
jgi:hypothetical protein